MMKRRLMPSVPGRKRDIARWLSCLALASHLIAAAGAESIVFSKHNLSVTGPGEVRSVSETRICVFCHTPHGARDVAPLWNRDDSIVSYLPYDSPTLKAQVGQPTGASKLCLSCHDGTIALGDLVSEDQTIAMTGGQVMPAGPGLIGADLRNDHPISFNYLESLALVGDELNPPGAWDPRVRLDPRSDMQCTSCHDPHDDQWGDFLVMSNLGAALCRQCHHLPFFDQTSHAISPMQWSGGGRDPWPHTEFSAVSSNACMNCHRSHHADGREELLSDAREEETCFVCHDGNVARANLRAVFQKPSSHPVAQYQGAHQAGESPLEAEGHVECADCHNPHRARPVRSDPPFIQGVMEGVSGVDAAGVPVAEAIYEYQVCFKCHGEETSPPLNVITRQIPSFNTIREFSPASPSFHPVEAVGVSSDVPSLISPLSPASMIYCTDCHNNDVAGGGDSGLAGPHGSNYEFLLRSEYRTGDSVSETPSAYALCYDCHSRTSILNDESFPTHREHVVEQRISCSVCHDPHGIDFGRGNPVNHAHLINFDVSVVDPDPVSGRLEYRSLGPRRGECFLSCHGTDHSPESY